MFCSQPFYQIEIYENGNVFTCCPSFLDFYSIGNIFQMPFEEIWNGKKAQDLRNKMLSGDLSCCQDNCLRKNMDEQIQKWTTPVIPTYPTEISVSSDNACNVKCRICRDINLQVGNKDYDEELEKCWLPIFKDAKIVRFGCSGEPFASLKEKSLIKKISNKYPNIHFQIHTNGILGNEKTLKNLNIFERIEIMTVSIHSACKETYDKVVIGGNYQKVLQNLNLYSEMKKNGLIKFFRMIFVVFSDNYKDMPKFAELALSLGAEAQFWAYRKNDTELGRNYEKYAIHEKNHPLNNKLVDILKQDIFKSEHIILYPELKTLINQ